MSAVAKQCGVNEATVARYRKLDNWDERLAVIRRYADRIAIERLAKRRAKNLDILSTVKRKMCITLDKAEELPFTMQDMERVMRLEELQQGQPESRTRAEVDAIDEDRRFIDGLTFGELQKAATDGAGAPDTGGK